jgi:hypothetical protein
MKKSDYTKEEWNKLIMDLIEKGEPFVGTIKMPEEKKEKESTKEKVPKKKQ